MGCAESFDTQCERNGDSDDTEDENGRSERSALVRLNMFSDYVKQSVCWVCSLLCSQFWEQLGHILTRTRTGYLLSLIQQEVNVGVFASNIEVFDLRADIPLHLG